MAAFRLGKKPARPGAVKLRLAAYLDRAKLPAPPSEFSYAEALPIDAGMLGNDRAGDCCWAGFAHETMLWDWLGSTPVTFDDDAVLADYSTVTGFDPANPATDQGTDLQVAASYRRQIGIVDAAGERHRVGAYVALDPGDLDELKLAAWIFAAAGLGLIIGDNQIDQFLAGQPWGGAPGPNAGGHYVPVIGFRAGLFQIVTFGKLHQVAPEFVTAQMDEGLAWLSEELLRDGLGPTGLNLAQLQTDLTEITA